MSGGVVGFENTEGVGDATRFTLSATLKVRNMIEYVHSQGAEEDEETPEDLQPCLWM
jgi:hypothetical protein